MTEHASTTVVGTSQGQRLLLWTGFPLLGAVAGWLLKSLAGWVVSLPWAPFQGPFELAASLPEPQATIVGLAVGVVAGLVLAWLAERDQVTASVGDTEVTIARGDFSRTVQRDPVEAVFVDGKQLVVVGTDTRELVRVGGDLEAGALESAFREHGYPWRSGGDPYADQYRRWVDGLPDLPAGANALLKARARALDKDDHSDADQLRDELAKLGVAVRDEKKRQFWRTAGPAPGAGG